MADSLCGPSNALQNFQKQSSADRTLQQDRLVGRPSSASQGFRSPPGANAGLLDPEFEAFQASHVGLDGQHAFQQQFSNPSTPFRQQSLPTTPHGRQSSGPSEWASDFQRLQVSSPQSPAQFHGSARQRPDNGGWHQDFAQQYQSGDQRAMMQAGQNRGQAFGRQFSPTGGMGMGMGMQQYGGGMMGQAPQLQQQHHPAELFDEAAFAKAFEEASQSEMERSESREEQEQESAQTNIEMGQQTLINESAERFMASDQRQVPDQEPIGSDLIQDPKLQTEEDPDALARTASHLLDSVSNNTSSKFANSEFLELMRQFRDRQVKVQGDNIVESGGEMAQDGTGEEAKVERRRSTSSIRFLLSRLRHLALNPNIDPSLSNERSRQIIQGMLQISYRAAFLDTMYFWEVMRMYKVTLCEVIDSPFLQTHPAIQNLASSILLGITPFSSNHLPKNPSSLADRLILGDDSITRVMAVPLLSPSPLAARPSFSSEEEIQDGNTVTDIVGPDTPLRELVYGYITDLLSSDSGQRDDSKRWLEAILGYEFVGNPSITDVEDNHIQRAREIVGTRVVETIDELRGRGIWGRGLLNADDFFELVEGWGKGGSE